jgi:O-antigen/teichoic acid export membrane protein
MAVYYTVASIMNLPLAYGFVQLWGLNGAALSLVVVELFMLVVVLRQALPAAHDTLLDWIRAISKPPVFLFRMAAPSGTRIVAR